ncbi:GTPase activating protein (GAP) for Rho1p [Malassezia yamatoensis]|uniref:GTPase activating protein (GAP) for Rho1p n=1 Tax=Malassezia yamatoensis TaxID=253288 RepID=A0AAJ5YZL7_9BASI|nr:GTPase activating protein (GAP) for Rho1p [Malassezia yamatoensis]
MAALRSDDLSAGSTGLRSWWSSFARAPVSREERTAEDGSLFGAPLHQALKQSSVAISLVNENGEQYVWGYVPAIVAKIGLYLKQNATDIEGIFRINGSEKRMKELRQQFNTPPDYGKGINWDGYNVHDAATLLRRFLNSMPEPIIPIDRFQEFSHVFLKSNISEEDAVSKYRSLITSCPPATQYLLLYILDLLAVFDRASDVNKMNAKNLAILFQPGMLMHPSIKSKDDHQAAVHIVQFLIDHQDRFVLALSDRPPADVLPEDLAKPKILSRTGRYLLVPSDSDEDLGEMEAHVGGGAMLAQNSHANGSIRKKNRRSKHPAPRSPSHDHANSASPSSDRKILPSRSKPITLRESRKEGRKRANSHSDVHETSRTSSRRRATDAGPSNDSRARSPSQKSSGSAAFSPRNRAIYQAPDIARSSSAAAADEHRSILPNLGASPSRRKGATSPSSASSQRSSLRQIDRSSLPKSTRDSDGVGDSRHTRRNGMTTIPAETSDTERDSDADSFHDIPAANSGLLARETELPPTPPEKDTPSNVLLDADQAMQPIPLSSAPLIIDSMKSLPVETRKTADWVLNTQTSPGFNVNETRRGSFPFTRSTTGLTDDMDNLHTNSKFSSTLETLSPVATADPTTESLSPSSARDVHPMVPASLPSSYYMDPRLASLGPVVETPLPLERNRSHTEGAEHSLANATDPPSPHLPNATSFADQLLRPAAAIPYATAMIASPLTTPTTEKTEFMAERKHSSDLHHAKVIYTICSGQVR